MMALGWMRRLVVLTVAALISLALVPAEQALAQGSLREVTACPLGKIAIAGGAHAGAGLQDFHTRLRESAPERLLLQYGWLNAVANEDAVSHTISIFAVCVDFAFGYQVIRTEFDVAAGQQLRAAALCPSQRIVLGGGARVVGEGNQNFLTTINESSPGTANGGATSLWITYIRNEDPIAHRIGVFAVCGESVPGYQIVNKDLSLAAGGFVRDTAECPQGKVVLGGGAAVIREGSGDFRTVLQESAPGTIGGGARSVWLTALRNNDTVAHLISISAICANPPPGYEVIREDITI